MARVKGILRRLEGRPPGAPGAAEAIERGPLRVHPERHECSWAGTPVVLTVTEFGLLLCLLGKPGKVYSRDELVEGAYGSGHHVTHRTVDSHVRRIRKKFKALGADPIETVYGLGFRATLPGDAESA